MPDRGGDPRRPSQPGARPGPRPVGGAPARSDLGAPRPRQQPAPVAAPRAPGRAPVEPSGSLSPADVRRYARLTGRVLAALLSAVVFVVTGYGWAELGSLSSGLTTQDVIAPEAQAPLGEQNILLVGLDTRTDAQGNPLPPDLLNQLHAGGGADGGDTTDTMIVVHIPAGGGQAVAFSIPRDSYVELPGYGKHKINSAYTNGKVTAQGQLRAKGVTGADLENQADAAGAKLAIQTVQKFTGLTINHYAAVNLAGFYFISQAVGGVPVCLVAPVHDHFSGANFPAGPQTVGGAEALEFVRQRHGLPNGDLDRIKRQQVFMGSMANTVLSAKTLTNQSTMNNLADAIKKAVVLDKGWDVLQFAQQLAGMSAGAIRFVTIPIVSITLQTPDDGDAVEVDPKEVQAFVQQQLGGSGSTTSAAPTTSSTESGANRSDTTVDVYNARGTTGLATRVLAVLTKRGYTGGTTVTVANRRTTVIDYASGQKAAAQDVAQALGGGIDIVPDSALAAGHVRVYLGADYSGPGTDSGSGTAPAAAHLDASVAPTTSAPNAGISADQVHCIN